MLYSLSLAVTLELPLAVASLVAEHGLGDTVAALGNGGTRAQEV